MHDERSKERKNSKYVLTAVVIRPEIYYRPSMGLFILEKVKYKMH